VDKATLDRPTLIYIASVVALGFFGAGLIASSALSHSGSSAPVGNPKGSAPQPQAFATASPGPSPSPTPTPNLIATNGSPQCSFADFPFYPGSETYHVSPPIQNAWYIDQPTSVVAAYFGRGANQKLWTFLAGTSATVAAGSSVRSYEFLFNRGPGCSGKLRIFPETLMGASIYQALPDAP
jgi:hypothetical protein